MSFLSWVALAIAGATFAYQIGNSIVRTGDDNEALRAARLRLVTGISVSFFLAINVYYAVVQYEAWHADGVARYLLPPYQSPVYFFVTIMRKLFLPWLLALFCGVVISRVAETANARFGGRFFYADEFPLIMLGFFLVGYPGCLLYGTIILLGGTFLVSVGQLVFRGRISLRYFWMPAAVATLVISGFLPPRLLAPLLF